MDQYCGKRTARRGRGAYRTAAEIDGIVREYIAAGGRVMINPRGELQHQLRLSALLAQDAKQAATDFAASFERLTRNKKHSAQLAQLVQDLGSMNEGGWIILEAGLT